MPLLTEPGKSFLPSCYKYVTPTALFCKARTKIFEPQICKDETQISSKNVFTSVLHLCPSVALIFRNPEWIIRLPFEMPAVQFESPGGAARYVRQKRFRVGRQIADQFKIVLVTNIFAAHVANQVMFVALLVH